MDDKVKTDSNIVSASELTTPFKWFRSYVGFIYKDIFYKDIYYLGRENIPSEGTPVLVASNHQNSLNDAFGIMFSMPDRKVHFITRADVFVINPLFTKLVYWIGLLPAFRMGWEGEAALSNNDATFKQTGKNLLDGRTVVIFPEAGHQNKHYLGSFSYGYTKMAFEAAEASGFEKEIFILPACNHYTGYFNPRESLMVRYGTPVSLKPYYELYKTKPRTAQRQVGAIVRGQIDSMMLDITDLDNYGAIDFLRQSEFGVRYAESHNLDPENLPEKLESDKKLVAELDAVTSEVKQPVFDKVKAYAGGLKAEHLDDRHISCPPSIAGIVLNILILLILSPLAVTALWPSVPVWFLPKLVMSKIQDKMLTGTFMLALNILIILPLCAIITLIVTWCSASLLAALIHIVLLPFLCLFEWFYYCKAVGTLRSLNYIFKSSSPRLAALRSLREEIYDSLKKIVKC